MTEKSRTPRYQCIRCQKWVDEDQAAMSKEGIMCLDCYSLLLKSSSETTNKAASEQHSRLRQPTSRPVQPRPRQA